MATTARRHRAGLHSLKNAMLASSHSRKPGDWPSGLGYQRYLPWSFPREQT